VRVPYMELSAVTMKMMRYLPSTLLFVALASTGAQAQERADVRTRNDCRLAAQVIRTGHLAPGTSGAYTTIRRCEESGPNVLAERWRTVTDPAEVRFLASASSRFPSRIIFDAISDAVASPSAGTEQKLQGLSLLASFARPGVFLNEADLRNPIPGRLPRIMSVSGDAFDDAGELRSIRPEVITVLERARDAATDPVVQRIANEYIRFLQ
jgi:hypothetical protein